MDRKWDVKEREVSQVDSMAPGCITAEMGLSIIERGNHRAGPDCRQSTCRHVKTEMPATSKWRHWADGWTCKFKDQTKGPEGKGAWGSLAHKWFLKPGAERNHFQGVRREKSTPTLTGLVIGPEIYLPMATDRTLK